MVVGPDHIGMMLSPFPGVKLLNWSVSEDPPLHALDWKDKRRTYFIYYAYGGTPVPLNVTIELMVRLKKNKQEHCSFIV